MNKTIWRNCVKCWFHKIQRQFFHQKLSWTATKIFLATFQNLIRFLVQKLKYLKRVWPGLNMLVSRTVWQKIPWKFVLVNYTLRNWLCIDVNRRFCQPRSFVRQPIHVWKVQRNCPVDRSPKYTNKYTQWRNPKATEPTTTSNSQPSVILKKNNDRFIMIFILNQFILATITESGTITAAATGTATATATTERLRTMQLLLHIQH